jgi:hypothetical protein
MAETYNNSAEAGSDRDQQRQMLAALGASGTGLCRDVCNAWCIRGTEGHIYTWGDGKAWVMSVRCRSARHWTATKERLRFCKLTQDGEDEGCMQLHRLPTLAEATVIREVLGIRKRAELSPGELERRRALGKRLAQRQGRSSEADRGKEPQALPHAEFSH